MVQVSNRNSGCNLCYDPTWLENEPLAKYTSWRIGGPARYFANAATPEDLREALAWARERECRCSCWAVGPIRWRARPGSTG